MRQFRRPSALLVAGLVLLAAFAGLSVTRPDTRPALPRAVAIRDALAAPRVAQALGTRGGRSETLGRGDPSYSRVRVSAVDERVTRVTFLDGPRIVAEAAVTRRGRVIRFGDYRALRAPYGVPLAYAPWLIALGCLAFALATAVVPLRRVRNLDVLALLGLVAPVVLLDARLLAASTLAALPSLAWLAGRCAWVALHPAPAAPPARPLLDALTPGLDEPRRARLLRIAVAAAAAAVTLMTVTAQTTVDVGQAVMEGGTLIAHGVLPYGHMPGDVFHGDTYPLLTYLAYAPLAVLMPVRDNWDVANGALLAAAAAAVAIAWMLMRAAGERRDAPGAPGADAADARLTPEPHRATPASPGLRAALAFLTFPPLVIAVSTGTSDVLLAALLAAALLLAARRPLGSTGWLIAAGWFKVVPFALLPIWLARLRGRRLAAALALLAATALATAAALVALGGPHAPAQMLQAVAFQLERRTLHTPWTLLGIEWLQPFVQAAVLALVAGATVRVRRDEALASDPQRLAALAGAVLLGLQLAGNYWTFLYLAWVLPCLALSLLADAPRAAEAPAAAPIRRRRPVLARPHAS